DRKDVTQWSVVALSPQMRVRFCVDQLRADTDTIGSTLHASLDHVRDAEFIRNLTQVSLYSALVLHHRCPTDHFQIRNLGQVIQDFVLDAISKKGVVGISAQIFKWQHRNTSLQRRG